MKPFQYSLLAAITVVSISAVDAYAAQVSLAPAKNITHLDATLAEAKSKIQFKRSFSDSILPAVSFVAFPEKTPSDKNTLYASLSANPNDSYTINIDSTADCQGAKMCSVGALTFQPQENITVYFDRDNKQVTSLVILDKGMQGFYTRGFAMADYLPANIQWRDGDVLYTLSWNIDDKKSFINMANSVIKQLRRH